MDPDFEDVGNMAVEAWVDIKTYFNDSEGMVTSDCGNYQ